MDGEGENIEVECDGISEGWTIAPSPYERTIWERHQNQLISEGVWSEQANDSLLNRIFDSD
jgi:hypothetical protein